MAVPTGAEVDFNTTAGDKLTVYTTRPDTLYGATYMVVSPEHPFIEKWADKLQNLDAVRAYQAEAAKKSDFERTEVAKDKTGVRLEGVEAINPLTGTDHSDLHFRLRSRFLRYRRHHGCSGTRYP